jgi:hypothetical protein
MKEHKFKQMETSADKIMTSLLCDSNGIVFVEFLKGGAIISSQRYVQTLKKLNRIRNVRPKRKMNLVLILPTGHI